MRTGERVNADSNVIELPAKHAASAPPGSTQGMPGWQERWRDLSVLSRQGGTHPAPASLQGQLILFEDGELLVESSKRIDTEVLEYMDAVQRKGVHLKVKSVDGGFLQQVIVRLEGEQVSSAITVEETSVRQDEVLSMLAEGVRRRVSDIHIEVVGDGADVRYRIDGALTFIRRISKREDAYTLARTVYQSMTDVAEPVFEPTQVQDARIKTEFLSRAELNGCRVGTIPTDRGFDMVLRLMPRTTGIVTLEDLGFHPEQIQIFGRLTQKKTGVNIFSGPTGSGKTTGLAVMMESIVKNFAGELKAFSLENPPEQRMRGVSQVPVHEDGWAKRLKGILRVDPDVIMVGEMRDHASAEVVLQSALTGHGVWTTLHANNAVAILQRMRTWNLDRDIYTDPQVVTGLINQGLVRLLCKDCKVPWASARSSLPKALVERVEARCDVSGVFVRGQGCENCYGTGCKGRTVVAEVIAPTLEFMRVYNEQGAAIARDYWRREMHGITKLDHLAMKIEAGLVDPDIGEKMIGLLDDEPQLNARAA